MPSAARGDGVDTVFSVTGSGGSKPGCPSPLVTATDQCSGNVFINGSGAVRIGDSVAAHIAGGCGIDTSGLTSSSGKVFVNGKGAGRIGDEYTGDNTIISGSTNVFIG